MWTTPPPPPTHHNKYGHCKIQGFTPLVKFRLVLYRKIDTVERTPLWTPRYVYKIQLRQIYFLQEKTKNLKQAPVQTENRHFPVS